MNLELPPIPSFPQELRQYKSTLEPYVHGTLRIFGTLLCHRINPAWPQSDIDALLSECMSHLSAAEASIPQPPRNLRLVLRHDCQSTGCGDANCALCQYNPSRLCTRNLKQKYLIDDHLKAKCGAPLRVELVDEAGACYADGLPSGVQLEMHVLNGEKYKELCPDNTLLSISQIRSCIISHHTKALLRREGQPEEQLAVYVPLERGQAAISDLAVTTSSEALLSGKAPTFRLLVWAVDSMGEPVPYVTYVVSENFVVATKRVKHAIKSDIPSVGDHISKLLHIGKATVEKLADLRASFSEEGVDVALPEELVHIDRVGQFRQLVELSEGSADLKTKLRNALKLSPEKWEEVCQHALSAVQPDFRSRVWWCRPASMGLLFQCKNGSVQMDTPTGLVRLGQGKDLPSAPVPLTSLSSAEATSLPKLKQSAVQNWYMPGHPNWAVYDDPSMTTSPQPSPGLPQLPGNPSPPAAPLSLAPPATVGGPVGPAGGALTGFMRQMQPGQLGYPYPTMQGTPHALLPNGAPGGPGVGVGGLDAQGRPGSATRGLFGGIPQDILMAGVLLPPGGLPHGLQPPAQAQHHPLHVPLGLASPPAPHPPLHRPLSQPMGPQNGVPQPMPQQPHLTLHPQQQQQQQQPVQPLPQQQPHSAQAVMAPGAPPPAANSPASQSAQSQASAAASASAFMTNAAFADIMDAFPNFQQPPVPSSAAAHSAGEEAGAPDAAMAVPSLDLFKTDQLMGQGMSAFGLQSMGTEGMRSLDWIPNHELQEVPTHSQALLATPGGALSYKLDSISLELDMITSSAQGEGR